MRALVLHSVEMEEMYVEEVEKRQNKRKYMTINLNFKGKTLFVLNFGGSFHCYLACEKG